MNRIEKDIIALSALLTVIGGAAYFVSFPSPALAQTQPSQSTAPQTSSTTTIANAACGIDQRPTGISTTYGGFGEYTIFVTCTNGDIKMFDYHR